MMNSNIKRGIIRFSEKICEGLNRPSFKFITQMIYGLLNAQSCHISEVARKLNEKTSLKKTIERLCRNLKDFAEQEQLFANYIKKVKGCISERTILIIDGSDIAKPCSPKMEHIGSVLDGSSGKYADGYQTLGVTALTPERKMPICVYTRVYSDTEPGFKSENIEVLNALDFLSLHFKKNNIRALDRGYGSRIYYERLMGEKESFVIRAKKNRIVLHQGKRVNIYDLAEGTKSKFSLKIRRRAGKVADCKISIVPIRLPFAPEQELNLVVCKGIGKEPLMLITNLKSNDERLSLTITKVYLLRWKIEEFYGFKKQQFDFEDFRVRSLATIRNLDMLVTIAIGYIGLISEKADERKIVMELIEISKRIYETPKFVFYAIADGLYNVMAKSSRSISDMLRKKPPSFQLSLPYDMGFYCVG